MITKIAVGLVASGLYAVVATQVFGRDEPFRTFAFFALGWFTGDALITTYKLLAR
jgi:hypothetical protein